MDWIKVDNKGKLPENGNWYWVTIENLFGNGEIIEAEYKNDKWYTKEHIRLYPVAWYPVKRPKPFEIEHKKEISAQTIHNDDSNKVELFSNEYQKEYQEKIDYVTSDEYLKWLYLFISEHKAVADDSFLYKEENLERKNSMLVSYLQSYLSEKYESTYYDEDGYEHWIFKLKDKYFDIYTIVGQGACTYIEECIGNENAILL